MSRNAPHKEFLLKPCPQGFPSLWPKSTGAKVFRLHELFKRGRNQISRRLPQRHVLLAIAKMKIASLTACGFCRQAKFYHFGEKQTREENTRASARQTQKDTRGEVNALAGTILSRRNKGLPAV